MSLIGALLTAQSGLTNVERQIGVTSTNITQAGTAGYTRETYTPAFIESNGTDTAAAGLTRGTIDANLSKTLSQDTSTAAMQSAIASYWSDYDSSLGGTDDTDTTISSEMDALLNDIQTLSDGSNSSTKATVVSDAQSLASSLNGLSQSIQSQRQQADQAIATSIDSINSTLDQLKSLNDQIVKASPTDSNLASLEDQRNTALQSLSQQIGINYYVDSTNAVHIYTPSGQPLLNSTADHLSYTPAGTVTNASSFGAITLQGSDVTSAITGGTLGGLLQMRDTALPKEQAKLDTLANQLKTATNTILNQGASLPPRTTLTSDVTAAGTDAFAGTGSLCIAVTNTDGTVQSSTTLDLSSYSTVDDLMTALNGISGVSASIDANGHLTISATASGAGISLNEMDSAVGSPAQGFSSYFGLNDMFSGTNGAADIGVSSYLSANTDYLATGSLSTSATAGQSGIASGDISIISALSAALGGNMSFPASGGFAAQQSTLSSYASAIISSAAISASNAGNDSDTSNGIVSGLQGKLADETGVDINTESANTVALQNYYSANAQLISTVRDMFTTLLAAYNNT